MYLRAPSEGKEFVEEQEKTLGSNRFASLATESEDHPFNRQVRDAQVRAKMTTCWEEQGWVRRDRKREGYGNRAGGEGDSMVVRSTAERRRSRRAQFGSGPSAGV